jgi:hypothetical protein
MKKYREFLAEKVSFYSAIDSVNYGHSPIEYVELANREDDPIKNWFIEKGIVDRIVKNAPSNSSDVTRQDLESLLRLTGEASVDEITFARHVDSVDNLAQTFIDLLAQHNHKEDMGGFFYIDSQIETLLFFLKDVINRPRPYQLAKYYGYPMYPLIRTDAMTAAYPSGHALTGFVMSEHYAKKYPEIAGELRAHGERIARSREITGIHYPSDTAISKEICQIICENGLIKETNL